MAYVADNLTDEEDQQNLLQQNTADLLGGTPMTTNSGAGTVGSGVPSTQAPAAKGTGFTNLRTYLNANQDQSGDLGNQVAANVGKEGQAAQNAIDTNVTNFNSDVAKGTVNPDTNLISQAVVDPVSFDQNPASVQALKNMANASYSGPTSFETYGNYGDLANNATTASDLPNSSQTLGGQQKLVRDLSPNQTQGEVDLNQGLIAGNPSARSSILTAAQPFANLKNYLSSAAQTGDTTVSNAQNSSAAAKQAFQNQFTTPETKTLGDTQNSLTTNQNDYNNNENILQQASAAKANAAANLPISYDENALLNTITGKGWDVNPSTNPQYSQQIVAYLLGRGPNPGGAAGRYYGDPTNKNAILNQFARTTSPDQVYANFLKQNQPAGVDLSSWDASGAQNSITQQQAQIKALQDLLGIQGAS